jgi:hypothetical protein
MSDNGVHVWGYESDLGLGTRIGEKFYIAGNVSEPQAELVSN